MASAFDIARWVLGAGWKGGDAVTATAVGLVAADPSTPGGLFGLGNDVKDGPGQARQAFATWTANGFDWSKIPGYTTGRHRLFIPTATAAVTAAVAAGAIASQPLADNPVSRTVEGSIQTVTGAATNVERLAGFVTAPNAWKRVSQVFVGFTLIAVASMYLAVRTGTAVIFYPLRKLDDAMDGLGRTAMGIVAAKEGRGHVERT